MVLPALKPLIPHIFDFGKFRKEFGKVPENTWKFLDVLGKMRKIIP